MAKSGDPVIDIALGTYNGALFLEEQLATIAAQSHTNWHLLIRDDGSSDETCAMAKSFARTHADRVTIVDDQDGNLGVVGNFSCLLGHTNADYIAFCDQDDHWLAQKLEAALARMKTLEDQYGAETPLLVFTDLTVVDKDLKLINPSFWAYQSVDVTTADTLSRLLITNVVTGCTILMNKALKQVAYPVPPQACVHDWWIALCAAAFGRSSAVAVPQILYRKHENNATGPRRPIARMADFAISRKARGRLAGMFEQAAAFEARFQDRLSAAHKKTLRDFLAIPALPVWQRLPAFRRGNYYGAHPLHLTGLALLSGQGGSMGRRSL